MQLPIKMKARKKRFAPYVIKPFQLSKLTAPVVAQDSGHIKNDTSTSKELVSYLK